MKRILVVLLLIVGAAATANAQTPDTQPATVKGSDTVNFRFSPLGLIIGEVDANLDFKVNSNWTLGPELGYWHTKLSSSGLFTSNFDVTALAFGARANWFANGVYKDGLYVGPNLSYASVTLTTSDATGTITGTDGGLYAGGLVGYGWFWDNFNIMLGGGAIVGLGNTTVSVTDSSGNPTDVSAPVAGLDLEFSLGWTF